MGREIKRVPLNFSWPLNKVWHGYLNPLYVAEKCRACGGDGYSPEAARLRDLWYGYTTFRPEDRGSTPLTAEHFLVRSFAERNVSRGNGEYAIHREAVRLATLFNGQWCHHLNQDDVDALVDAGRLKDFTHEWMQGQGWKERIPAYQPTAQEVNEWSIGGMGHDSSNQWIVCRAECKRNGWAYECSACGGEGEVWPSEDAKAAYEAWEGTEPPVGDGWQLWETVSEGSPVSPVFQSSEDLVLHLMIHEGNSEEAARAFVARGFSFSGVVINGTFIGGIEGMHRMEQEDANGSEW